MELGSAWEKISQDTLDFQLKYSFHFRSALLVLIAGEKYVTPQCLVAKIFEFNPV